MSFGAGFQRSSHTAFGVLGWANALDFGVRGDGVTDDGVYLSRLFDQVLTEFGGGVVVLSPTVNGYRFDEAVPVPAGVTVMQSAGVKFTAEALDTSAGGMVWDLRQPAGTEGPAGPAGPPGDVGPGVPTGGALAQILTKTSATDFESAWQDPAVTLDMFTALAARVSALEAASGT